MQQFGNISGDFGHIFTVHAQKRLLLTVIFRLTFWCQHLIMPP